ncbi:Major Facilitator Superfamily protein [Planctomycetes bacterium MalM25]|nr:Major Facilitator Superfamily protein [Planctomycetes bacterium MalM25]
MSSTLDESAARPSSDEAVLGLGSDLPQTESVPLPCEETHENEPRNFVWLALHQVLMRVGWVFKTESIVMPFFMDAIGGDATLRGSLMVFNRLGFSVPPALFARSLKLMPQKRWAVCLSTFGMAIPFAVLSIVWASGVWRDANGEPAGWMPYFFLAAYAVFFTLTGLNQLAIHSIGGKLIRPQRRGRLFAAGVFVGAPIAIAAAWWLMPQWLRLPDGGFTWLFAAPAVCFALASVTMLAVREKGDDFQEESTPAWRRLWDASTLAFAPGPYRRVAIVALLFSATFTLFPHYQALARELAEASGGAAFDTSSLMVWTVTQHLAVAVLSLFTGPMADRLGNRAAVRFCVIGAALAPLTAAALGWLAPEVSAGWFWIVFLPLGFTPVTIKMLINYTLELAPREEHPRYVSAVGMCLAWPVIIGSPLVGALVGVIGCAPVFALGAVVILAAGAQTLLLAEPRHAG